MAKNESLFGLNADVSRSTAKFLKKSAFSRLTVGFDRLLCLPA